VVLESGSIRAIGSKAELSSESEFLRRVIAMNELN
jgi:hypothetical protein